MFDLRISNIKYQISNSFVKPLCLCVLVAAVPKLLAFDLPLMTKPRLRGARLRLSRGLVANF